MAEQVTGVSAPPAPTENTDTALAPAFAVASSPPPELNATETGCEFDPVVNGEPVTCVSAPPAPTENTDTLLLGKEEFAVASSPPPGLNATDFGPESVVNGEPVTWVSAPVDEFTRSEGH